MENAVELMRYRNSTPCTSSASDASPFSISEPEIDVPKATKGLGLCEKQKHRPIRENVVVVAEESRWVPSIGGRETGEKTIWGTQQELMRITS